MEPLGWIVICSLIGFGLLVGEFFLPTHGLLGVGGLASLGVAVGFCFAEGMWIGFVATLVVLLAMPVGLKLWIDHWPKTAIARAMFLPDTVSTLPPSPVQLGEIGVALTEMRPMGECEFGDRRVQSISERGIIPAGSKVKVVSVSDGQATVRVVPSPAK